jgi:hypothetical protein
MNIKSLGIITLAAVLVVGCGGGGGGGFTGGGPESATAVITEDNAEDIIRAVASSSEFSQSLLVGLVLGADSSSAQPVSVAPDNKFAAQVNRLLHATINGLSKAETEGQFQLQPLASAYCSSGSATVNGWGTSTVTFNFNNCADFSYQGSSFPGTTDGQLVMGILSLNSEYDYVAELIFNNFSSENDGESFMADGSMVLDYLQTPNQIQFNFSADRFDYTENEESGSLTNYNYELDFNLTQAVEDGSGGVESSKFSGLVFFTIPIVFVTLDDDDHSSSGMMVIYGINNTKIRLTALDATNARIELDLTGGDPEGGDGDYEIDYTITWNELLLII